ncbi:ClpXP protease specificity-enhancing factor [Crenothrix polyspora]|jgi:stringent starvation protein B|uniref:ClpXP protease specificity-enhancing factor n=1 Tax=Crenothrix polyspora TaxID=360316 RepID=A0A1R4H5X7_9GAMM|nr:ClpXP protease specificity-enhancing factor [Crenothrix polyspora]SJM91589.1 ClpXP protease specificity-enhancing factor [Crenothrix polyspora]
MTPLKPYLIRSIYEWIIDNDCTPHLLVDATHKKAILPMQFIDDGKIVLNIKPAAVDALSLGNEEIEFNARFSGKSMYILAPMKAILAIYAKESGKGMVFDAEGVDDNDSDDLPPDTPPTRPALRVVK